MALANRKQLLCHVDHRFTSQDFVRLVKARIGPFVRSAYPNQAKLRILFDGEPLLHTREAKAALAEFGIIALPGWPAHSPDLNPQENVWPWLGNALRAQERKTDSFVVFRARLTRLAAKYPSPERLIASMPDRVAACLAKAGAMTRY